MDAEQGVPFVPAGAEPFIFLARGDQPHSGQRMRGPDVSLCCSTSWSGATAGALVSGLMLFGSLNSLFFGKATPIPPDHKYILAA